MLDDEEFMDTDWPEDKNSLGHAEGATKDP